MNDTAVTTELRLRFAQKSNNEHRVVDALLKSFNQEALDDGPDHHVRVALLNLLNDNEDIAPDDIFQFPYDYTDPGETPQIPEEHTILVKSLLSPFARRLLKTVQKNDIQNAHIKIFRDLTTIDPRNQVNSIQARIRENMKKMPTTLIVDAAVDHINLVQILLKDANSALALNRGSKKKNDKHATTVKAALALAEEIFGLPEKAEDQPETYRKLMPLAKIRHLSKELPKIINALKISRYCASRHDARNLGDPALETRKIPDVWTDLKKWRHDNAEDLSRFKAYTLEVFSEKAGLDILHP